jgi:ubiquinone/menaquinone biosynthesis C-methylase UbiE
MTGIKRPNVAVAMVLALLVSAPVLAQSEGDAGREKYEKVDEILSALSVATASRVADIGAGDGFFSVRIARALSPGGRVTAVDVAEKALAQLRQRLEREKVTNVDVTLGAFDSPRLPADTFDAALIYNSYHEMTEHTPMLRGILFGLKPGGRLVIIEPIRDSNRSQVRAEQTKQHEISDDLTVAELQSAGFQIVRKDPQFRPFNDRRGTGSWWLIVATKPNP